MAVLNKLLEQRAYTDTHTGLPNKDACEVLLNNKETVAEHTACIMFDLNNLKIINDTRDIQREISLYRTLPDFYAM